MGGQNIIVTKHLTQTFVKWIVSDVHNFNTPEQGNKYRKQWYQHTHTLEFIVHGQSKWYLI